MKVNTNQLVLPKYLTLLAMLYGTILCICAVLALYIGDIDHFVFSEGAAIVPLMYFLGDVITEVYGYKTARRVTWYALAAVLFFMGMIMLLVHVPVPSFWHLQYMYEFMYDRFSRVMLCFALFIPASEFVNTYIISKLKILCRGRWLWMRSLTSSLTGELVIAILGNITLFAGNQTTFHLFQIIFASFAIKATFSAAATVPCVVLSNALKKTEKIDVYDYRINYNPFRLD